VLVVTLEYESRKVVDLADPKDHVITPVSIEGPQTETYQYLFIRSWSTTRKFDNNAKFECNNLFSLDR
jgi:hypothetical protein